MNIQFPPTDVIYNSFGNILQTSNIYIIAKRFTITIKYSKKEKKIDLMQSLTKV